jgi:hypothetical protein
MPDRAAGPTGRVYTIIYGGYRLIVLAGKIAEHRFCQILSVFFTNLGKFGEETPDRYQLHYY